MKTIIKLSLIALMATSTIQARDDKPYEVKSIKIEFDIKGKNKVGTKRVIIDDYGNRELVETNIVKKFHGKVKKYHHIRYLHRNIFYGVDFNKKTINRLEGYMGMTFGANKFKDTIDESLRAMHLKKVGTDKVAGVECDVWQLGTSTKTCYYKGLPLRKTMNGVVETATKIEIDVGLNLEDFKLPDFPVNGKQYTQKELEAMDSKSISKENKKLDENAKAMLLFKEAYKKAGVVKGKKPTKEQMKRVEEYMQNAMFPIQKKKMIEGGKRLKKIKPCYEKAQNIKEAKKCNPQNDELYKWNDSIKKEMLAKMNSEEKMLKCVEKSSNGQEMRKCFPEDD